MRKLFAVRSVLILLCSYLLLTLFLASCGDTQPQPVEIGTLPPLAATSTPIPAAALSLLNNPNFGKTNVAASLVGSGSTFAEPVYKNWFAPFAKNAPNVKIDYQGIGSGSGRNAFLGTPVAVVNNITPAIPTDFAGSDAPFRGDELLKASNKGQLIHLPTALGAVVVAYNLKEVPKLNLSGPTLASIYQGITPDKIPVLRWNAAIIQADNPGVTLPDKPIKVIIRTRKVSSGTSEIFTRYLSVVSDDFRSKVGPGGDPNWPTQITLEGNGNAGVAELVSKTDGAIGYIDQGAADTSNLTYAAIRNKTGRYILPNNENVSAAATGSFIPDDFRTFIVNGEGGETYPIVGFTWIIVWRDLSLMPDKSKEKAEALGNFLWWAIHDGQKNLPKGYAPLPDSLIPRLERLFVTNEANPVERVFIYQNQTLFPQK